MSIINDVLDLSKIEAGKLELEQDEFDLRELVEDVTDILAEQAHAKKIEVSSRAIDPPTSHVVGDSARIRQVLVNLVGNAIKFTQEGQVAIDLCLVENDVDSLARIQVSDTGIGIAPEQQATVFDVYSQIELGADRRYGGSGLGLAIVKRLVELMNGTIELESEPGRGSIFAVEIPLGKGRPLEADPRLDARGRQPEILIVEDNPFSREALGHLLTKLGGKVRCVSTGAEALHELHSRGRSIDLAIVDASLQDSSCAQFLEEVERSQGTLAMPVLVLVPVASEADVEETKGTKRWTRIQKPVRTRSLLRKAVELLTGEPIPTGSEADGSAHFDSRCRVLLAEDNVVNQEVALEMLRALECQVDIAGNGEVALERFADKRYDVILMDCQMPEMDGYEATRRLRQREKANQTGRTPVVALTAHALKGDRERCLDAGMDDHMTKPFTQGQLASMLRKWIGAKPDLQEPVAERQVIELDPKPLENLRMLERQGGRTGIVEKVIRLYLQSSPELVQALEESLGSGDADALTHAAHSLKTSSANVGGTEFADQCKKLESLGREGRLEEAQDLFAAFRSGHASLCLALERELESFRVTVS
jgi:CheY-like chemotaxis protein/HPt (histidine-containing phosphotransfer) domain-containing protein/two-component sensor histidine kinase